jgi:hypothetical protein
MKAKGTILHFLTEFVMVFLGVLFAFFVNDWAEQQREKKYVESIVTNLIDDVKMDSANVIAAIDAVGNQNDSLAALLDELCVFNYKTANSKIYYTYFCYNVFEPRRSTYQSMVYGGDMKLVDDLAMLRSIKDLDEINEKVRELHVRYRDNVETFRNAFICRYNIDHFNFANIPPEQGIEFWNRLSFLSAHVRYYYEGLLISQKKYNDFLSAYRK